MEAKKRAVSKEGIVLAIIIIVQLLTVICLSAFYKTQHDTDEFYSYGLANNYKEPFIWERMIVSSDSQRWMVPYYYTGDDFKYYLRTNDQTAFQYDSVYYNQINDRHPPLYYLILHTICSVCKGKFSWWYGFSINIISFVIAQIFMYLLSAAITHSKKLGLLITAYWGFTVGCISCYDFVRMYGMTVMFALIYAYLSVECYTVKQFTWKNAAAAASIAFLGAMTHHYFLCFAFFCTLFTCISLLLQKNIRNMLRYGLSALAGTLLSIAAFPATIPHLLEPLVKNTAGADKLDFSYSWKLYFITLSDPIFGLHKLNTKWFPYVLPIGIAVVILSAALIFLFRDKPFVKNLGGNVKAFFRKIAKKLTDPQEMHPGWMILLLSGIGYFCVVANTTDFFRLGIGAIRYLYLLMPFFVLLPISAAAFPLRKYLNKKPHAVRAAGVLVLAFFLIYQHMDGEIPYVKHNQNKEGTIAEYTCNQNCIFLTSMKENMQCISLMVDKAKTVLCTRELVGENVLSDMKVAYQKMFLEHEPFVLLIDQSHLISDAEYEEYLKKKEIYEDGHLELSGESEIDYKQLSNSVKNVTTESRIVSYFESISGYQAEYCAEESENQVRIAAYLFCPCE